MNSGRATARSSDRSAESLTDEEDSSGVDVPRYPSSGVGSQDSSEHEFTEEDDDDDGWAHLSNPDVESSEFASRPGTSNHHRLPDVPRRHHSRREPSHSRLTHRPAPAHRRPSSPPSVGSNEDSLAYGPDLPLRPRRQYYQWAPTAGGPGQNYAPSYSAQSYPHYPTSNNQLVPMAGTVAQYQYPSYQGSGPLAGTGYLNHHQPGQGFPVGGPVPPAPGSSYPSPEMMHHPGSQTFYPFPSQQGYPAPHHMAPSPVYHHYSTVFSPPPPPAQPASPATHSEPAKEDNQIAELKQMILDDKADREAREAAARKAEQERIAAAEADKAKAEEIAAAAAAAAAAATTEAEKKAAAAAAEEAEKKKTEADEAAAKAKQELEEAAAKAKEEREAAVAAAAAAATPPAPVEKKKPIKFKDAVGRKFSFPFHLCATWSVCVFISPPIIRGVHETG